MHSHRLLVVLGGTLTLNACVVGVDRRATRSQAAATPTVPAGPTAAEALRAATGPPVRGDTGAETVRPAASSTWVAGYHHWNGVAYVWIPGRWERRHPAYAWKR